MRDLQLVETRTTDKTAETDETAVPPLVQPVKLLLTPREAAQALGIGTTLLYSLLMRGGIRSFKLGAARRIPVAALHEFIEQQIEREAC